MILYKRKKDELFKVQFLKYYKKQCSFNQKSVRWNILKSSPIQRSGGTDDSTEAGKIRTTLCANSTWFLVPGFTVIQINGFNGYLYSAEKGT